MRKVILLVLLTLAVMLPTDTQAQRTTDQLQALYNFNEGTGEYITGVGPDLLISNIASTNWSDGGLVINAPITIESMQPASDITASCIASNELTLEVWIRNSNITASGPARIMSLSQSGIDGGNFMMGQDGQGLVVRCLTTDSDKYGNPAFNAGMLFNDNDLRHIVYIRNTIGDITVYVNGILRGTTNNTGQLSNWGNHTLTLASESMDDGARAWLGELRLCAIYSKALTEQEVINNYNAGEGSILPPVIPDYNPVVDARALWDAPTYGTVPVKYIVQHSIDNGAWYDYALTDGNTTTVGIAITFFNGHRVRVAGIDAQDRQGPFSLPSNIYVPANVYPHPPTQPIKE